MIKPKNISPLCTVCMTPFICLSDITDEFHEHNVVFYNPNLPEDTRREKLKEASVKYFNLKLDDARRSTLTPLRPSDMDTFIQLYRSYWLEEHG